MKKIVKKLLIVLLFCISICIINQKVDAATFNLDCVKNIENSVKTQKIYQGEEIFVKISVNGITNGKVMAMTGVLDYDKDVLELVQKAENSNCADITLGDKWSMGNLTTDDSKFLVYTTYEDRNDTVAYVKFKVKDDLKAKSTVITAKDVLIYDSEYQQVSKDTEELSMNLKISKKVSNFFVILTVIATIVIIAGIALVIIMVIHKDKKETKNIEKKDKEVKEKKDNAEKINSKETKKENKKEDKKSE